MRKGVILGIIILAVVAIVIVINSSGSPTGYPTYSHSESSTGVACDDSDALDEAGNELAYIAQTKVKGETTITNPDGTIVKVDEDVCSSASIVTETYCEKDGKSRTNNRLCPNGCANGACI